MEKIVYPANDRGTKDIGWLQSNFTFSFSSYRHPAKAGFGLLRVFNDDFVEPGKGFGLHAHMNMEIISIMLKGNMNHKDTMGYSSEVSEDWVQIMSAGSGLRHEEYNIGDDEVNFLQIWIEPKLQNIMPRYQRRQFPKASRANQLTTAVSNQEGQAHCWINQNAKISLGYFTEEQENFEYKLDPVNKGVFIFNIAGDMEVAGEKLAPRDAIGVWDTDIVSMHLNKDAECVVIEVPINH